MSFQFMKDLDDITESPHYALKVEKQQDGKWKVYAPDEPLLGAVTHDDRDYAVSSMDDRIFMFIHRNQDDPKMPWDDAA